MNVATPRRLADTLSHTQTVNSCAWSPDCNFIASCSGEYKEPNTVHIWKGHMVHVPNATSTSASSLGRQLLGVHESKPPLTSSSWREVMKLEGHSPVTPSTIHSLDCCAWSPDGTRLAAAWSDRTVRVWNDDTWRAVAEMGGIVAGDASQEPEDGENCCAWSPDSARLASSGGSDRKSVVVWLAPGFDPPPTLNDRGKTAAATSGAPLQLPDASANLEQQAAADQVRLARDEAEVANKRARRLEGDPEALKDCSIEELRQLSKDIDQAGSRVRNALTDTE